MSRPSSPLRAKRAHILLCHIVAALCSLPLTAVAGPIDLNLLFREQNAPINIAADGSTATLFESPDIFDVFLSNVPGFGDPELITAVSGARLAFDFSFSEPQGNADIFHFALLDGLSGDALEPFSLLLSSSGTGSASFDLSSLVGSSLGLQFDLLPDLPTDFGLDSTLTISNLRIDMPAVAVPDPDSLALMGLGLLLIILSRLRIRPFPSH